MLDYIMLQKKGEDIDIIESTSEVKSWLDKSFQE